MHLQTVWLLLKETGSDWWDDKVPRLGAALAYYTILSAAPLLVIVIAIAGLAFGRDAAQGQVVAEMQSMIGKQGASAVQTMIVHASKPSEGITAMVLGIIVLLVGASGVFAELQDSLNTIWEVAPKPGLGIWQTIKDRLLSFAMVLCIGFILLVSLAVSAGLAALSQLLGLTNIAIVGHAISFLLSFAIITLLFAMIYKILPDVKMNWSEVWVGAVVTALLFTIGKFLIGLYLGHSTLGSTYGAAGSLVVFVVWVYYSSMILFLGAEFTKVYARRMGGGAKPEEHAVPLTEEARAQQGIPHQKALEKAAQG